MKEMQVSIKLDSETKRQLRILAAEKDTNLSTLAGQLIRDGLNVLKGISGEAAEEVGKTA